MKIQLQSILLPQAKVCDVEELYYHREQETVKFDGYFNLFYIEKRKAYTRIDSLYLSLELEGYQCLELYHDQELLDGIQLEPGQKKEYTALFPYQKYEKGCFWFALKEDRGCAVQTVKGFFCSELEADQWNPVNIGIDICTFKREPYVANNLEKIKRGLLERQDLDVCSHLKVYVIDNGRTLKQEAEIQALAEAAHGDIRIYENKNAGGAGGFTRGMLEVLKDQQRYHLTHVLLMDDDAVVEPDSIVRLYGFLVTVKQEWKDITVGGAMLREDYPYMLFCAGEQWINGKIISPEMHLDIRDRKTAMDPYLTETGHEQEWYSGWWWCCFSLNTVREDNLPLPVFIHQDDIEFGLRNKEKGIVFLNGIGVWHKGSELSFPGANLYYDVRNNLINTALHGTGSKKRTILKLVFQALTIATIKLRYQDTELIYRGLLDFLKGPEWLAAQNPEGLNGKLRSMACQTKPAEELIKELPKNQADCVRRQLDAYKKGFGLETIIRMRTEKTKATLLHYMTFNGWLLPADGLPVKLLATTDSPFDAFRKRRVFYYEPGTGKAAVSERSYQELWKIIRIYRKSFAAIRQYADQAVDDYERNIGRISNQKSWEEYLNRE